VVEEVTDKAEVRQSSSSLLSAAASFRRPALTVMVLGAAAVIVVLARHTLAKSLHVLATASPGWLLLALAAVVAYRFISFWLVLLGGWVAFPALAHPLRRRLSRGSPGR
jgi:uncharacterized membrane protein YbhN (UPF0104 family)